MLGEYLKIGDKVEINIPDENREWGYNPCPDGTIATVTGFSTIPHGRMSIWPTVPGIFLNHSWVKLQMPDGKEHTEYSGRLTMIDKQEFINRQKEKKTPWQSYIKVADLPVLPFWEGDFVKINRTDYGYDNWTNPVVTTINYAQIGQKNVLGEEMPIYQVSPDIKGGSYSSFQTKELTLVKRGNVWNYYHKKRMEFRSIAEKAEFFHRMGTFTEEVRNPRTNDYGWSGFEEIRKAIRDGIGDAIFGNALYKFKNKKLGKEARSLYAA